MTEKSITFEQKSQLTFSRKYEKLTAKITIPLEECQDGVAMYDSLKGTGAAFWNQLLLKGFIQVTDEVNVGTGEKTFYITIRALPVEIPEVSEVSLAGIGINKIK